MRTLVVTAILACAAVLPAQETKPPAEAAALVKEIEALKERAEELAAQSKYAEAKPVFEKALALCAKAFPDAKYPDGNALHAYVLNNYGSLLSELGAPDQAVPHIERSLRMRRKLFPESKYPNGHEELARSLNNLGAAHEEMSQLDKARPYFDQSLAMQRKLHPASKYPNGHKHVALALRRLGDVHAKSGAFDAAEPCLVEALSVYERLFPRSGYPDGLEDLALCLKGLGTLEQNRGEFEKAHAYFERAVGLFQQLYTADRYPDGHPDLALSYTDLGVSLQAQGAFASAIVPLQRALAIYEKFYAPARFADGCPDLASCITSLGMVLQKNGQYDEAIVHLERANAMWMKLLPPERYPNGHFSLAVSLNNLGLAYKLQGSYDKALPCYERGLSMMRNMFPASQFPDGHPNLIVGSINLARLFQAQKAYERATSLARDTLTMAEKLYPEAKYPAGHASLAIAVHTLGSIYKAQEQPAEALPLFRRSVQMRRLLFAPERYPKGHPDLAGSLHDLGGVAMDLGDAQTAGETLREALAMRERLFPPGQYPDGHAELAVSWHALGVFHDEQRDLLAATEAYRHALGMQQRLLLKMFASTSEAEARAFAQAQPPTRDGLLSITDADPTTDAAVYRVLWAWKAMLTRVLEMRQAALRSAGSGSADKLQRLGDIRRIIERLLQDARRNKTDRDRELSALADERDRIERDLARMLPTFEYRKQRETFTSDELISRMPAGTAFVDFIAYEKNVRSIDPKVKPKVRQVPSYAAFVIRASRPVKRVELGPARPIDEAVAAWRRAIEERRADADASKVVAERVWIPLAAHLPHELQTVFLAPDGDLARLPFAALPGSKPGRILLEDFALAIVPHGPFLLENHTTPPKEAKTRTGRLVVGGVAYGESAALSAYPALPGTEIERRQVLALAEDNGVSLHGSAATVSRIRELLPMQRYAHLSTHGFFNAAGIEAEKTRQRDELTRWRAGADMLRVGLGTRNPLVYTGLVFANANRPTADDSGLLTGERIVDLPLENLKLVTLSACETGLGELTGGEGVQGLQRAFHLAGCPNVVASLWKVNDAATAALMVKFYHELWVNKKPPIDALREAQLTIYRRPDLIPVLAAERGIKLEKAIESASTQAAPDGTPRGKTPTKLWAAFVLSGVGK